MSRCAKALVACARKVLRERGLAYDVTIAVGEEYFNTRSYDGLTLPAGRYRAVRVILGEGSGQNWWCVMFPPLCLPAAERKQPAVSLDAVLTSGQLRLVKSNPKYEIRFKIVELWEGFWEHLRCG
jgi:stage II sporulation protein R